MADSSRCRLLNIVHSLLLKALHGPETTAINLMHKSGMVVGVLLTFDTDSTNCDL